MAIGDTPKNKLSVIRHYAFVMAFAVSMVASTVYGLPFVLQQFTGQSDDRLEIVPTITRFERSLPTRLVIPSIHLDTTFVSPLGLNTDQSVSVPDSYTQVGWYKNGSTPGEIGPAVILGHVDSKVGPAVFYSLGQVSVGDSVEVTRLDGTVAIFEVTELKRYPQTEFPTEQVYGAIDESVLRLVTCTGLYSHNEQRYSHNLVVYARLKY